MALEYVHVPVSLHYITLPLLSNNNSDEDNDGNDSDDYGKSDG